jgi:hypothetical protein
MTMVRAAALFQEPPSGLLVFDNPGYQTRSWGTAVAA